jgi:hypothetical protein
VKVGDLVELATPAGVVLMSVRAVATLNGREFLVARTLDDSWGVFMAATAFTVREREGEG